MNTPLIQYTIHQRGERVNGLRVLIDGTVQSTAPTNPLPTPTERLDHDHDLQWQILRTLTATELEALQDEIRRIGFFDLPATMLINYCKEDPGTAIWIVNLDGQMWRVLVWDPRPKRSPALDTLMEKLKAIIG